jgi:hypothetical protein
MKRLLPLALVFLSGLTTSLARIGENVEECVARYGPVVERLPAKIKESDPQSCVFSKSGITIIAEFKAGKAWQHTYRMAGLDEASVSKLLEAEAEAVDGGWSSPIKIGGQEFRSSADGKRIAVTTYGRKLSDVGTLVVAQKSFAEANREGYKTLLDTVSEEVKRRAANQPLKGL